jgi:hypothetical protein
MHNSFAPVNEIGCLQAEQFFFLKVLQASHFFLSLYGACSYILDIHTASASHLFIMK